MIISPKKLRAELESWFLSEANATAICVHNVFAVPKSSGAGYKIIVDCSKPEGESVNNHVSDIVEKFSYLRVGELAENMNRGDYIAITYIKDAYRAITIHPSDRPRQAICWDFGEGPNYFGPILKPFSV